MIKVNEGEDATFNCSEIIPQVQFTVEILRPGDETFSTVQDPRLSLEEVGTTAVYTYGPVERAENGSRLRCNLEGNAGSTAMLHVYRKNTFILSLILMIASGN